MINRQRKTDYLELINVLLAWLAGAIVVLVMLAICYAVFMRYAFRQPLASIVEISSYAMLYITFLGTAWLLRQDGHVQVDLILGKLNPKARSVMDVITSLFGLAVALILTWQGLAVTVDNFRRQVTVANVLNTPQFLLIGVIPLGGALLTLEFIRRAWRSLKQAAKQ